MNWLQKIAGYYDPSSHNFKGFWLAPSGKSFIITDTHHAWISDNIELLKNEYDIDIESWEYNRTEERIQSNYNDLVSNLIKEKSWKLDIEESEVILDDEELDQLREDSLEIGIDTQYGVEIVDYLIENGWVRIALKFSHLYIEGDNEKPKFWDIVENFLIANFSVLWKNPNYTIMVNNTEIYSKNLQEYPSLREAIEHDFTMRSFWR